MKTIKLSIGILMLSFASCSTNTASNGLESIIEDSNSVYYSTDVGYLNRYDVKESGMQYVIYTEMDGGSFAVNITKDSLEVLKLKNGMRIGN